MSRVSRPLKCIHCRRGVRYRRSVHCTSCIAQGHARQRRALQQLKPWWERSVWAGADKEAYFLRVCAELERPPTRPELWLSAGRIRVHT